MQNEGQSLSYLKTTLNCPKAILRLLNEMGGAALRVYKVTAYCRKSVLSHKTNGLKVAHFRDCVRDLQLILPFYCLNVRSVNITKYFLRDLDSYSLQFNIHLLVHFDTFVSPPQALLKILK